MNGAKIEGEAARLVREAEGALIRCRDGAAVINLLVRDPFNNGLEADTIRNALDWASEKLAADIETATNALDRLQFDRAEAAESAP